MHISEVSFDRECLKCASILIFITENRVTFFVFQLSNEIFTIKKIVGMHVHKQVIGLNAEKVAYEIALRLKL